MTSNPVVRTLGRPALVGSILLTLLSCAQPAAKQPAPGATSATPPPAASKPSSSIGDPAAMAAAAAAMQSAGADHPGKAIYASTCAVCHDKPEATRSPSLDTLRAMRSQTIEYALTQGKMQAQASSLSRTDGSQVGPSFAHRPGSRPSPGSAGASVLPSKRNCRPHWPESRHAADS